MFWNSRFEYHMGRHLSQVRGISTLTEPGLQVLQAARAMAYPAKRAGFKPRLAAESAIDTVLVEMGALEDDPLTGLYPTDRGGDS